MTGELSGDEWITVFQSRDVSAEIEAETIHSLLEAAGIDSLIVRENVPELPTGRVSVRVLSSSAQEAQDLIQQARDAGAEASEEEEEAGG